MGEVCTLLCVCVLSTSQGPVQNLDSNNDELPTLDTDVCCTAASPHFIIVCQINIKHQFLGLWLECSGMNLLVVAWLWVDGWIDNYTHSDR